MKGTAKVVLLLLVVAVGWIRAERWDAYNNPLNWYDQIEYALSKLPLNASTPTKPWSDTYWPSYQSGIAHRWMKVDAQDFEYRLFNKSDVFNMTYAELRLLSPAEKYDLFVGRYDYPTVNEEWMRTSKQDAGWEGLCHGWAPASATYFEPRPVNVTSIDGLTIPFGSSDVKALLTFFAAMYSVPTYDVFLGNRCNFDLRQNPNMTNFPACKDMNAGSVHVLLANSLGGLMTGSPMSLMIDRDRSIQVWNQPVFTFTSKINRNATADPSDKDIMLFNVSTTIRYTKETMAMWDPREPYVIPETYIYQIEVNMANCSHPDPLDCPISGGSHVTWDRPDFAWNIGISNFYGYWAELNTIYNASIANFTHSPRRHHNRGGLIRNGRNAVKVNKEVPTVRPLLPVPHSIPLAFSPNRDVYTQPSHSFGLKNYPNNYKASWVIKPEGPVQSLMIIFNSFSTERYRDRLRIYENAQGTGALIAVLHGTELPNPIRIDAPSALVVFVSDDVESGGGFEAKYLAQY